jgi:hypothetical protein
MDKTLTGNGINVGTSIKQVAVLQLGEKAVCLIGCQASDIHPKDWVGLYANSAKGEDEYITWQYASKCDYAEGKEFYNTKKHSRTATRYVIRNTMKPRKSTNVRLRQGLYRESMTAYCLTILPPPVAGYVLTIKTESS